MVTQFLMGIVCVMWRSAVVCDGVRWCAMVCASVMCCVCGVRGGAARAVITMLAGSGFGYADGFGSNVGFNYPAGVAFDANGNVFVADTDNQRIRKLTPVAGKSVCWSMPSCFSLVD